METLIKLGSGAGGGGGGGGGAAAGGGGGGDAAAPAEEKKKAGRTQEIFHLCAVFCWGPSKQVMSSFWGVIKRSYIMLTPD